jgi:hypothetical protein
LIMPDELQQLWQQDNSTKENNAMWLQLIQEKRRGFDALVRAEGQAEYVVSLIFMPLCGILAWKAKFPLTQAGYALLAATFFGLATSMWITGRPPREPADKSLREHLRALLNTYDRYLRLSRSARLWVTAGLVLGCLAVVFGIPGSRISTAAQGLTCIVLAGVCWIQWRAYSCAATRVLAKRGEAARLLGSLPAE